ncbi:transposase [Corynebacterium aquatimens]|uniref:DDE-type integrase/transposase/recombinase n=1 Tax=Corynebacterium TaxID=1716 RepID=UPI001F1A4A46|nr:MULTISPECIES: DDE-type integrase/transposase/recombinase [Corynebacterium]QYH19595.1 transposase [Corynebacterium aquatimens]UIZ91953.1 transposase [Corynebacterium sp. CNCTC7651]
MFYARKPRPTKPNPTPHTARNIPRLSEQQVDDILALLDANPYSSVDDVYYNAYNHGLYIASLSSFYRTARQHQRLLKQRSHTRRRNNTKRGRTTPPHVIATAPGQVLCWDITFLPGPCISQNYACLTVIDLYSRAVVGTSITPREQTRAATELFTRILSQYPDVHTVHSDNGPSMTSTTIAELFHSRGITQSFSRPHTSNDNPHMESLFHTMKGSPYYPPVFASIDHATNWVSTFTTNYNSRPNSAINYYTPQSVLDGTWRTLQTSRHHAIQDALEEGRIHTPPKTPTGLPREVTIIRTTTTTHPSPQPLTTNP